MDWGTVAGVAVDIGATMAFGKFAPGLKGSVVGGAVGGALGSAAENWWKDGDFDFKDTLNAGLLGAAGGAAGHGASKLLNSVAKSKLASTPKMLNDMDKGIGTAKTDAVTAWKKYRSTAAKAAKASGSSKTQLKADADKLLGEAKDANKVLKGLKDDRAKFEKMRQKLDPRWDKVKKATENGKGWGAKSKKANKFEKGAWGSHFLRGAGSAAAAQARRLGGGEPNAGGGGNGGKEPNKPGPAGPTMQTVEVAWGGSKYTKGEQKEPFVPDPRYTTVGNSDGFLLYPIGLDSKIKAWYVG